MIARSLLSYTHFRLYECKCQRLVQQDCFPPNPSRHSSFLCTLKLLTTLPITDCSKFGVLLALVRFESLRLLLESELVSMSGLDRTCGIWCFYFMPLKELFGPQKRTLRQIVRVCYLRSAPASISPVWWKFSQPNARPKHHPRRHYARLERLNVKAYQT